MLASPQHFGGGSGMTSFYVDLPGRMLLLNLLSGGFYSFLWFYRHWRHYKRRALQGIPGQPKDPRILPIWSSLFCSFYIIGTARRIRAKMVELHLHGRQTKPLATFFLFNLPLLVGYFESTNNLAINAMMLLLTFCVSLLSSYQVYRLQKFANLTMKNEGDIGIPSRPLNLWDLGVVLMGGALTLLGSLGILIPASMLN
jgi:hypothetical protein